MKLYGVPPTRAIRPIWFLNLLGLECETVPLDPLDDADRERLAALNPSRKVPVLEDGDLVVTESVAISLHLAERYGDGTLLPADTASRAMTNQWLYFLVTEIEQPLWRMALHEAIYPAADRRPDELPIAARDCRRELARIETLLADRTFFLGDAMSVVDPIAAYTLDWADEQGLLDASPNAAAYVARMYDHPAAPPRIPEGFAYLRAGRVAPNRRADLDPAVVREAT